MTANASPDSPSKMVLRVLIFFPFTRTTEGAFGLVPTNQERIGSTARHSRSSGHDDREMGRRSPFLMVDRRGGGSAPYPPTNQIAGHAPATRRRLRGGMAGQLHVRFVPPDDCWRGS